MTSWRAGSSLLLTAGLVACGGARPVPSAGPVVGPSGAASPAELARADGGIPPHTPADVEFMAGMIVHHAQAVLIAGWAPSHEAGAGVRVLCERIVVAQRDEIGFMQHWLRGRGLPVPDADPSHFMMPGMGDNLHPGMLSTEQLRNLDQARGAEFDRLFLTYMIQHHEGAITMVDQLLGSTGAAQDDDVWKLAADIHADQTTEINRMHTMLAAPLNRSSPSQRDSS